MKTTIKSCLLVAAVALVGQMVLTGAASAQLLGSKPPPKAPATDAPRTGGDGREGGETIADAIAIEWLPFADTGNTCDNLDDYDEVCPYTGSTSPDVVYSYHMAYAGQWLTVDLCTSLYDTKVYVYGEDLELLGCNDDFYTGDPCGLYTSKLEIEGIYPEQTVYIVVDGYGGDCGEYAMWVTDTTWDCFIECPPDGQPEGEPSLEADYVDAWNGGCNSEEQGTPFQALWGDPTGHLELCGVSGWYPCGTGDCRDTDWFTVVIDDSGAVTATLDPEEDMYLYELWPQNCDEVAVAQLVEALSCDPTVMEVVGAPGDLVWLWAGPTSFTGQPYTPYEFDYVLTLDGLASDVVEAETNTWSDVKGLYR